MHGAAQVRLKPVVITLGRFALKEHRGGKCGAVQRNRHAVSGKRRNHNRLVAEFPPELHFEAMSEEHGHLDSRLANSKPKIGDKISIIPNHVCACVNLHEQIWQQRGGVVEGCWTVAARGKVR